MAACPSKPSFLGLPVEIRNEIYRYLLSSKYIRRKIPYHGGSFETTYFTYTFHKNILRTSRKVYQEAVYILRTEALLIRFTTNHPWVRHVLWGSQGLIFLAHGNRAGRFRRCAMEINHYRPQSQSTDNGHDCSCTGFSTCLLVSDQLPNFLRLLRAYSQQGDRSFARGSFSVRIFYHFNQVATQYQPAFSSIHPRLRNLLDPFKLLYEVENLHIKGKVNEQYKQSVVSSATQPEPTVAEIINAASAIKIRGDEAFLKHEFDLALSLYTSALSEIQVNHYRLEYTGDLTTGDYAGMSTAHAVRTFKIRIHANLAAALVKVGEYRRATDHAREAIKQIITRQTPREEWQGLHVRAADGAKPFLWGGLAYEGLGDLNRAIYGVGGGALAHCPGNKRLEKDYRRLEEEIEKRGIEPRIHEFGKGTNWWLGGVIQD